MKEKKSNISIINALLKSENFFAHFHLQFQFLEIDFLFSSSFIHTYKSKNIIKTENKLFSLGKMQLYFFIWKIPFC